MSRLTHSELCDLCIAHAVKRGAVLVSSEKGDRERPDVFALFGDGSTVVYECKASRSDFKADRDKPFRKDPEKGMGMERIYVVNEGVCRPSEIPDGWRLAYATDLDSMTMVIPCFPVGKREVPRIHAFNRDAGKELALVASALASGTPPVPSSFDVRIGWNGPSEETMGQLRRKGRCPFCRNRCRKDAAESFSCGDFIPDYGKLLE